MVAPLDGITKIKPPNITIVWIPVMRTTWSLNLPGGHRYLRPGGNMSPAAATVEMLSLGIEAKLEQLKRLERAYRDVAGSYGKKGMIAKRNLDTFNIRLGGEIQEAEKYLARYRGQIRLDFARSSGGAELSIWAVPAETLDNLYGTTAVIVTFLVIAGLVKVWPRSMTKHSISARHIVGYILLLILLPLLLGLLGLLISLIVILFSEAKRGAFTRRAIA